MSINPPAGPVPSPADPPYPAAGPARAHVRRLRQDGGTYRGIAAAAGLAPATVSDLDRGRRRPNRGTTAAVLAVTSKSRPARPRGRRRHPAAAAGPARDGPRLGPHRPRPRRPRDDHPPDRPRRRPHRQPQAPRHGHRPVRRLVGQARPRPHPVRPRRGHRRPQTRHRRELVRRRRPRRRPARHPRLPAPARLETRHRHRRRPRRSGRAPAAAGGTADDQRPPDHPRPHPRRPGRAGTARLRTAATTCTPTAPSASSATWPASTKAPRTIPPSPTPSRCRRRPAYPGPSRHDAVTLTRADASTVFAALDIAADDKRYRAEMCPDCPDQSCPTCQIHLRDAQAFDQMADRMLQAAQAAPAASASQPGPDRRSQPAADREAGQ